MADRDPRQPYTLGFGIVPSDALDLAQGICDAVYVGGTGDVTLVLPSGMVGTFPATAGETIPVPARRIRDTGTTATHLVALYHGARQPSGQVNDYDAAVMALNPVAYWHFDEPSGLIVADETGDHPAAFKDATGITRNVPGIWGAGVKALLQPSPTHNAVTFTPFTLNPPFTICGWITLAASSSDAWLYVTDAIAGQFNVVTGTNSPDTLTHLFYQNFDGDPGVINTTPLALATRYFVGLTVQDNAVSTFYLQGQPDGTFTEAIAAPTFAQLLGDTGSDTFNGNFTLACRTAIFPTVLSAAQMLALYTLGIATL